MLDFYTIKDDQANSSYPEEAGLEFAGDLDDITFDLLQNKGVIDQRFDYYSDFRWGTALIQQMQQYILQKQLQSDSDVKKLLLLLDAAEREQSGLAAYGD